MTSPRQRPVSTEPVSTEPESTDLESAELQRALIAVEAAYSRLITAPGPDRHLLHELRHRAHELTEAADRSSCEGRHAGSVHVRRRCVAAGRGADWIIAHCR